jgi:hypothetical protein
VVGLLDLIIEKPNITRKELSETLQITKPHFSFGIAKKILANPSNQQKNPAKSIEK